MTATTERRSSREKDLAIIRELQRNARQTNVALAKVVGLSEGAVRRRIDRMVSEGHLHFAVVADAEYIGYRLHVLFQIQTDPDSAERLIGELVAMDELSYVYHCTGQFNACVVGYFESTDELREFTTDRLGKLEGLVELRTVMILRVAKRSQAPSASSSQTRQGH